MGERVTAPAYWPLARRVTPLLAHRFWPLLAVPVVSAVSAVAGVPCLGRGPGAVAHLRAVARQGPLRALLAPQHPDPHELARANDPVRARARQWPTVYLPRGEPPLLFPNAPPSHVASLPQPPRRSISRLPGRAEREREARTPCARLSQPPLPFFAARYKEKAVKQGDNVGVGLFDYPVLMPP